MLFRSPGEFLVDAGRKVNDLARRPGLEEASPVDRPHALLHELLGGIEVDHCIFADYYDPGVYCL